MVTEKSKGFLTTVPSKAIRAATIKNRFADIIEKAKSRKISDSDVMVRIQKEKLLETREREEKARMEGESRAVKLKLQRRRRRERFVLEKMEEEAARSMIEENIKAEKELVNLCGGSFLATIRWVEALGLVLRSDDDGDCLIF